MILISICRKRTSAEGCTLFMYIKGKLEYDGNLGVPYMKSRLARKVSSTAMSKKLFISTCFMSTC